MKPAVFFDVSAGFAKRGESQACPVLARVVKVIHGIRMAGGPVVALAFPDMRTGEFRHPGQKIRIFTETDADANAVIAELMRNDMLRPSVSVGHLHKVEDYGITEWVEYRRFRTPARGAKPEEKRRQAIALGNQLPLLRLRSRSNGHEFCLHFRSIEHANAGQQEIAPSGYGFSTKHQPFALPVIRLSKRNHASQ